MDTISDGTLCRICFKKQDTVFSLFRKRKGIAPCEKLNKIGVKTDSNDTGPSCICCGCLTELETTVHFLEKCKKSNQILAEHLGEVLQENECNERQEIKGGEVLAAEDPRCVELYCEEAPCEECGSRRRCRHRAPAATHTCPKCQKVFNRKYNFNLHLKRHSRSRGWWCATCGAGAVSAWLAARHCVPRARRLCPVPGCGKTYTTNTNLTVHLRAHNGERPFECNDCGKKFSSKNTLQNHIRIHTGALPYICPICGKQFRTNKLSAHLATHTAARHSCPHAACSKRFTTRAALQRHALAHAGGGVGGEAARVLPPAHACCMCAARYRHKQSLNKHVRKQHGQHPVPTIEMETYDITKDIECDQE